MELKLIKLKKLLLVEIEPGTLELRDLLCYTVMLSWLY